MTVSAARPAPAAVLRDALRAAAEAGPFFRLELLDRMPAAGWTPAADFYRTGLAAEVARTARQLGTSEPRVAASILQLGLAARLWSPVLGCGLLRGVVPDLSSLLVSDERPVRFGLAELAGWTTDSPTQLAAASAEVVGRQLMALAAGLPARLAAGLLRGNSASAMAGALGVLTSARPNLARPAVAVAQALLARDLSGAGKLGDDGPILFRRRSCCLYYRVPDAVLCGDCCLTARVSE